MDKLRPSSRGNSRPQKGNQRNIMPLQIHGNQQLTSPDQQEKDVINLDIQNNYFNIAMPGSKPSNEFTEYILKEKHLSPEFKEASPASTVFQKYASQSKESLSSSKQIVSNEPSSCAMMTRKGTMKRAAEDYTDFSGMAYKEKSRPNSSNKRKKSSKRSNPSGSSKNKIQIEGTEENKLTNENEFSQEAGHHTFGKATGTEITLEDIAQQTSIEDKSAESKSFEAHDVGVGHIGVGVDFADEDVDVATGTFISSNPTRVSQNLVPTGIGGQIDMRLVQLDLYQSVDYKQKQVDNFEQTNNQAKDFDESRQQSFLPVVAQILPERNTFEQTILDKRQAKNVKQSNQSIYLSLNLESLVTLHNTIIKKLTQAKQGKDLNRRGRMTANGVQEQIRRHTPNPGHVRNPNLAPSIRKPFEKRTLRKINFQIEAVVDFHRFFVNLRKNGQYSIVRIPDVPLFDTKSITLDPQGQLKKMVTLINQVQFKRKQSLQNLDDRFKSGQLMYNQLVSGRPSKAQPSQFQSPSRENTRRMYEVNLLQPMQQLSESNNLNVSTIQRKQDSQHMLIESPSPFKLQSQWSIGGTFDSNLNIQNSNIKPNLEPPYQLNDNSSATIENAVGFVPVQELPHQDDNEQKLMIIQGIRPQSRKIKLNENCSNKSRKSAEPGNLNTESPQAQGASSAGQKSAERIEMEPMLQPQNKESNVCSRANSAHGFQHPQDKNLVDLNTFILVKHNLASNEVSRPSTHHTKKDPTKQIMTPNTNTALGQTLANSQVSLNVHPSNQDFIGIAVVGGDQNNDQPLSVNDDVAQLIASTRIVRESGAAVDDNQTISTHMLDEMEFKATDSVSKMHVNLQRSYHHMRKFAKSAANTNYFFTDRPPTQTQPGHYEGRNKQDSLDISQLPFNHMSNPSQITEGYVFNQLKSNQMGIQQYLENLNKHHLIESNRSKSVQRVTKLTQTSARPPWYVPTSRSKKRFQPSQKGSQSQSQVSFYKTTRASKHEQISLAVDHRNSNRFGDNQGDQNSNRDLLQMEVMTPDVREYRTNQNDSNERRQNQNNDDAIKLNSTRVISTNQIIQDSDYCSLSKSRRTKNNKAYVTERDRNSHTVLGIVSIDSAKMESVFKNHAIPQTKTIMKGSKLKSREITNGFKKIPATKSNTYRAASSSQGRILEPTQTEVHQLQESSINTNEAMGEGNYEAHVTGKAFRGTYHKLDASRQTRTRSPPQSKSPSKIHVHPPGSFEHASMNGISPERLINTMSKPGTAEIESPDPRRAHYDRCINDSSIREQLYKPSGAAYIVPDSIGTMEMNKDIDQIIASSKKTSHFGTQFRTSEAVPVDYEEIRHSNTNNSDIFDRDSKASQEQGIRQTSPNKRIIHLKQTEIDIMDLGVSGTNKAIVGGENNSTTSRNKDSERKGRQLSEKSFIKVTTPMLTQSQLQSKTLLHVQEDVNSQQIAESIEDQQIKKLESLSDLEIQSDKGSLNTLSRADDIDSQVPNSRRENKQQKEKKVTEPGGNNLMFTVNNKKWLSSSSLSPLKSSQKNQVDKKSDSSESLQSIVVPAQYGNGGHFPDKNEDGELIQQKSILSDQEIEGEEEKTYYLQNPTYQKKDEQNKSMSNTKEDLHTRNVSENLTQNFHTLKPKLDKPRKSNQTPEEKKRSKTFRGTRTKMMFGQESQDRTGSQPALVTPEQNSLSIRNDSSIEISQSNMKSIHTGKAKVSAKSGQLTQHVSRRASDGLQGQDRKAISKEQGYSVASINVNEQLLVSDVEEKSERTLKANSPPLQNGDHVRSGQNCGKFVEPEMSSSKLKGTYEHFGGGILPQGVDEDRVVDSLLNLGIDQQQTVTASQDYITFESHVPVTTSPQKVQIKTNKAGIIHSNIYQQSFVRQNIEKAKLHAEPTQSQRNSHRSTKSAKLQQFAPNQVLLTSDLLQKDMLIQSNSSEENLNPNQNKMNHTQHPYVNRDLGRFQNFHKQKESLGSNSVRKSNNVSLSSIEQSLKKDLTAKNVDMLRRNIMVHRRQKQLISQGRQKRDSKPQTQRSNSNQRESQRETRSNQSLSRRLSAEKINHHTDTQGMRQLYSVSKNEVGPRTRSHVGLRQEDNCRQVQRQFASNTSRVFMPKVYAAHQNGSAISDYENIVNSLPQQYTAEFVNTLRKEDSHEFSGLPLHEDSQAISFNMSGNFSAFQEVQEMIKTNNLTQSTSFHQPTNGASSTDILREKQQAMLYQSSQPTSGVGIEIQKKRSNISAHARYWPKPMPTLARGS